MGRAGSLAKGETLRVPLERGRGLASGAVTMNGVAVGTRDDAAISNEWELAVTAAEGAELVLVDVAVNG